MILKFSRTAAHTVLAYSDRPYTSLFCTFTLTEDCGKGRVWGIGFFNGAGYIAHPKLKWFRGFTLYVRLHRSSRDHYAPFRRCYPLVLLTRNPNNHSF